MMSVKTADMEEKLLTKKTEIKIGTHALEISNLDKVLFPRDGITKGDLIDYYTKIADVIIPHMKGRPLNMDRFPNGIDKKDFFQQSIPDGYPEWAGSATVPRKEGGEVTHIVCEDSATLAYMANLACVTPHIWLSRADKISFPDKMIFDLDPEEGFSQATSAAFRIRDMMADIGLVSFVMTTGSRGLHIVIPLDRSEEFDPVRSFARTVSEVLARRHPEEMTVEQHKDRRGGRLFLDIARNSYGQTSVAPYSVRAKDGAPVATPLNWDELGDGKLNARTYSMSNIFHLLSERPDPWIEIYRHSQSLKKAKLKLEDLENEL